MLEEEEDGGSREEERESFFVSCAYALPSLLHPPIITHTDTKTQTGVFPTFETTAQNPIYSLENSFQ